MKAWTLILVNPTAREGQVGKRWPMLQKELMEALGAGGDDYQVAFTSEEDRGSGSVRKALREGAMRVAVVGGDGSLSEALQGFFENGRPVSPEASLIVVPAGRGDDFFKSIAGWDAFGGGSSWSRALELIRKGSAKPTDIGRIQWRDVDGKALGEARYFLNIASAGCPGLVVHRVLGRHGWIGKSRLGRSAWAYLAQTAAAMREYKPVDAEIQVDGAEAFRGKLFSAFVMNGVYNGGGVRWSDEASVEDGRFHVLALGPQGVMDQIRGTGRMLSGHWAGASGAHLASGKVIEIRQLGGEERSHPLFEVDGDLPERPGTLGARIECLPAALRVWR